MSAILAALLSALVKWGAGRLGLELTQRGALRDAYAAGFNSGKAAGILQAMGHAEAQIRADKHVPTVEELNSIFEGEPTP